MRKTFFFFTIILLSTFAQVQAQSLKSHNKVVSNGYNFWLYQPAKVDTLKPVVIFLHGASLCGHNLNTVRRYGTIDAVEKGRKIDAYIIAPQNPGGAWKPAKIKDVLDWVVKNHNVDTTRVYILGMSLGGYGTIDFATTYPDHVAAAMALCGGGTQKSYQNLTKVPIWIAHGTADRAISVKESDKVVNAMKACSGGAPRLYYDRVPGMNHGALARAFYKKETYEWLFQHRLTDEGRPVAPKPYTASKQAFQGVYKGMSSRKKGGLIK